MSVDVNVLKDLVEELNVFLCVLLSTAAEPISGLLSTFKLVLLEHMILCRMVQGQMPQAIKEVHFAISVLFAIIFEWLLLHE